MSQSKSSRRESIAVISEVLGLLAIAVVVVILAYLCMAGFAPEESWRK